MRQTSFKVDIFANKNLISHSFDFFSTPVQFLSSTLGERSEIIFQTACQTSFKVDIFANKNLISHSFDLFSTPVQFLSSTLGERSEIIFSVSLSLTKISLCRE